MERDPRAYLWDVREAAEAILEFSRSHALRHTQVQPSRKSRHFGMDAEIQAMDGNQSAVQVHD